MRYIPNDMANDKFAEGLAKALAVIGGVYIFVELMKAFSKKEIYYSCPKCNRDIKHGIPKCPSCHTDLTWNFPNPEK